MLDVENLHSGYGSAPILNGVDLRVETQEFVGILGHNGMGKTTLLKTLMGLIKATSGCVRIDGQDATEWPPYRRSRHKIGYVPQGRQIFTGLTVLENLRMAVAAHRLPERETIERVVTNLPRLRALLDRPGGALSGGEQQILAVARALCTEPTLLLLDEPTEGIQPSIQDELMDVLSGLKQSRRLTLLLVEQNVDFISGISDRILIMEKGCLRGRLERSQIDAAGIDLDFEVMQQTGADP
jgi:branched-chain amino acid transport system ATP-binding protein